MTEDTRPYDPEHVARLEALAELINEWSLAREAKRTDVAAHNEAIKQLEESIEQARRRLAEDRDQPRLPLDCGPDVGPLVGAARRLVATGVESVEVVERGRRQTVYQRDSGGDDE